MAREMMDETNRPSPNGDSLILIFNRKLEFARIEVFYMKIIMRRVSVIFHPENHGNDKAIRRCLLDKMKLFYQERISDYRKVRLMLGFFSFPTL